MGCVACWWRVTAPGSFGRGLHHQSNVIPARHGEADEDEETTCRADKHLTECSQMAAGGVQT